MVKRGKDGKFIKQHGLHRTKEYSAWASMRSRCNNPNHKLYKYYGGRGITVCEKWKDFLSFLKDMGLSPERHSLDRINNDGNYEPSNCRWASSGEHANNRRTVRKIAYNGKLYSLAEISHFHGIAPNTVNERLKRGWSLEDAVTKPVPAYLHHVSEHGTRGRYKSGCRCDQCRKANNTHVREMRRRKAMK